jgi:hypothetical protein
VRHALALLLAAYCVVGTVPAADLTIDGGEVAIWNKEAKSYGNLYVGSTNGNGTLVAVDSTIDLSNYIYFGY